MLSDRIVVERKTGADLAASIKDRRLFPRIGRLREAYASVVLVVEALPIHIAPASWKGALGRALTAGASVLRTADRDETAAWLLQLHRLKAKGPSQAHGRPRPQRPTNDVRQVAEDVLGCLPGVSTVGARRLLDHFGSLAASSPLDQDQLLAVAGVGPIGPAALARLSRGG